MLMSRTSPQDQDQEQLKIIASLPPSPPSLESPLLSPSKSVESLLMSEMDDFEDVGTHLSTSMDEYDIDTHPESASVCLPTNTPVPQPSSHRFTMSASKNFLIRRR
jgi:hypothetical protein